MGRRIVLTEEMGKPLDAPRRETVFDGRRPWKLGTERNPAVVHVQGEARSKEVKSICEKHGWTCTVVVDPDQPEDIGDLERLLNPPQPRVVKKKIGRNEPCPCGSGKKYKVCCGRS